MERYTESARYIRELIGDRQPEILMILGSGLGFMAEEIEDGVSIPYSDIPHLRVSTVDGHAGKLVVGKLEGVCVMVMHGRMHCYEGYTPQEVSYPVRVAKLLGVNAMIVTNAAGAVNRSYSVGDLMLISDHIRFMGTSPLTGANLPEFGPRFCDMSNVYTKSLRETAKSKAKEMGIELREGVYFYCAGPQFETPAEIRAISVLGGDAVGMSTVFEATVAAHCGMKVLGISLMTNMAAGIIPDSVLDGVDVLEAAEKAKDGFSALVRACVPYLR
ncbi:MAG: purine-nucleoside phosphorylase [Clostridia bacterium]|nr:purine-nucleoside phosphorylase [Clostridia bacterium]